MQARARECATPRSVPQIAGLLQNRENCRRIPPRSSCPSAHLTKGSPRVRCIYCSFAVGARRRQGRDDLRHRPIDGDVGLHPDRDAARSDFFFRCCNRAYFADTAQPRSGAPMMLRHGVGFRQRHPMARADAFSAPEFPAAWPRWRASVARSGVCDRRAAGVSVAAEAAKRAAAIRPKKNCTQYPRTLC